MLIALYIYIFAINFLLIQISLFIYIHVYKLIDYYVLIIFYFESYVCNKVVKLKASNAADDDNETCK